MPTPTLWNIPYQRNPYFTGREDVLSQLHRVLHVENAVALSHPQGISGLGGIGKTQTALEYAYRYRSDYSAVFWIRADSTAALISSLVELAGMLQLPERDEKDQEIIVQAVLRWLRQHPDWLLIYDNANDLSLAEPFLPKAGPGHLLFTTRAYALGGLAQRLDIQKMEPEIGSLLLLRRADIIAREAVLDMARLDERSIARAISEELDGLPLALDQAGAYIKESPCLLPDYLSRYQARHSDLLRERGSIDQDYPASVATTWSLSFERVHEAHPAAADLLNFCAFLAPDAIPETIITQGVVYLPSDLQEAVVHPVQFDRTISALLAYSLLHRNANETLSLHRLVQTVLRDAVPAEARSQWKQRAVLAVNTASPDVGDFKQWDICEQWLPHAMACVVWIEQEGITFPEAAWMLNSAGYYLNARARYTEAEPVLRHALAISEQQLGADHPDTAIILNNLGMLYKTQRKYSEAEQMLRRTLEIYEEQLGPHHPDVALSLINLANLYNTQRKYGEVEQMLLRALEICEEQLGADHPDTARSLNNLAAFYDTQRKYSEAEPVYRRALEICEEQLGADHPDTARSLNNLAALYDTQGKYGEAEQMFLRALKIREQQLGADHLDTALSLNNLATLYDTQGKYREAEQMLRHVLKIREQQLGADHPDTALSLSNLATLYYAQGKYTEAEQVLLRALKIREQQLGADHPDTALSLNNLAILYSDQGKYAEAELVYRRALEINEEQLGPHHPDTALSLSNLATLYNTQGKYGEAKQMLLRALEIYEEVLGTSHPDTRVTRANYTTLLKNMEADGAPSHVFSLLFRLFRRRK